MSMYLHSNWTTWIAMYFFFHFIYCHPVIYSLSLFSSLYSVHSFIANVICYITIPSLNKVLYCIFVL